MRYIITCLHLHCMCNSQAESAKADKELHIYIIIFSRKLFVLNSSGIILPICNGIAHIICWFGDDASFSSVFHLKSKGRNAFVTVDVQFFVRFRTLCVCVLLADKQEIIHVCVIMFTALTDLVIYRIIYSNKD